MKIILILIVGCMVLFWLLRRFLRLSQCKPLPDIIIQQMANNEFCEWFYKNEESLRNEFIRTEFARFDTFDQFCIYTYEKKIKWVAIIRDDVVPMIDGEIVAEPYLF